MRPLVLRLNVRKKGKVLEEPESVEDVHAEGQIVARQITEVHVASTMDSLPPALYPSLLICP